MRLALEVDTHMHARTHTHTHRRRGQKQFQETRSTLGLNLVRFVFAAPVSLLFVAVINPYSLYKFKTFCYSCTYVNF